MFKVVKLKIVRPDMDYFNRLFIEAKWLYNHILAIEKVFDFDTKIKDVKVKRGDIVEDEKLAKLSSQMRQQIQIRMKSSIKALSEKKKRGAKIGKLRFAKFVDSIPLSNQTLEIKGNRVRFQCNKRKFRLSGIDQLPQDYNLRCASLVRKPSGIYLHVTILVENEANQKEVQKSFVGVDFGIKTYLTFDDGTKVHYEQDDKRLKKLHQNLSRKTKGSKRYAKALKLLRKEYEYLDNCKDDATNKLVNKLKSFRVCYQDEMIAQWHKGLFGKRVQAGILGRLKSALKNNTDNLMISRFKPTTKLCPSCGSLNPITLAERKYVCDCGYQCDRDTHSASNVLAIATKTIRIEPNRSERPGVERESDVYGILSGIQSAHLSVKREAVEL